MHPNIKALTQALTELNLPFSGIYGFPDSIVSSGHTFMFAVTPFNTESVSALCRDKAAVHTLLMDKVPMPQTTILFDTQGQSLDFLYPCIVKMNKGERGTNVFLVSDATEAQTALSFIFDKTSKNADYIALIQQYIKPACEIRVVVSAGEVAFAYEREIPALVSMDTLHELTNISKTIISTIGLSWGALDFIKSESGEFFFLEANTRPGFENFVRVQGNGLLVQAYKKALEHLLQQ